MGKRMSEDFVAIGPARATRELHDQFGTLVDDDYVPGKTVMRDALCETFGLSLLASEEICDALEAAGALRFVETPEGRGWHIHVDLEET